MDLHQLRDKNGGIHMQSFAVRAHGSKCFLLGQKVYLSHFSNAKCVEISFVKIKEYTHKMKKKQST